MTRANTANVAGAALDVEKIRRDFPALWQQVNGNALVYLDNAATSQKPLAVIEALNHYYREDNANVHRGVHTLSERATSGYEGARGKARNFLKAETEKSIVFVRGATEGLNLIAQSYGRKWLRAGDEIIVSEMEHHSNIVPWQLLCEQTGAVLKVIGIDDAGDLILEEYEKLLNPRTRIVAVTHVSNALGTVNPIKTIVDLAHDAGAVAVVDGAQAAPHIAIDVRALDCDFYVFSGHKVFAPTGVGVLYGKTHLLDAMPPWQGGGDMIKAVTFEKTVYNVLPYKFEAGTPNIAGVIGLGAALDYIDAVGLEAIDAYERDLLAYATQQVGGIEGLRPIGEAGHKAGVLSFVLDGVHPHDVGTVLDRAGIAIRAGHHCAMPVMTHFSVPATNRASFAFYNSFAEVDRLASALREVRKIFT